MRGVRRLPIVADALSPLQLRRVFAMTPFGDSQSAQLALVTGTSSGIGSAVAGLLLEQGWAVVGVARRPARIEHPRYRHLVLDLADPTRVITSFEHELAPLVADPHWQRVGLVNNAASADLLTSAEQIDPVALLRLYAINTAAPVRRSAQPTAGSRPDRERIVGGRGRRVPGPGCLW